MHHVVRRDAVADHHQQAVVALRVHVADLALIEEFAVVQECGIGHRAEATDGRGRGGSRTRVRCVATTQASTISEAATMPGVSVLAQQQRRPHQRQHRLGQLHLADLGDAAAGQARVPGEEAQEHADQRHVGEAGPGVGAAREVAGQAGHQRDRHGQRQRQHQRPADGLPAAQLARQGAPLGVAEGAEGHRDQHQPVRRARQPGALRAGEHQHRHEPGAGSGPERAARPLAREQHRGDGGGRRQQADDDRPVRRGQRVQRQRGEQREAEHHPQRHQPERPQLRARRAGAGGSRPAAPRPAGRPPPRGRRRRRWGPGPRPPRAWPAASR